MSVTRRSSIAVTTSPAFRPALSAADPLVPLELLRARPTAVAIALAVLGGATRASTFVLVALYLQQALALAPRSAGLARP